MQKRCHESPGQAWERIMPIRFPQINGQRKKKWNKFFTSLFASPFPLARSCRHKSSCISKRTKDRKKLLGKRINAHQIPANQWSLSVRKKFERVSHLFVCILFFFGKQLPIQQQLRKKRNKKKPKPKRRTTVEESRKCL